MFLSASIWGMLKGGGLIHSSGTVYVFRAGQFKVLSHSRIWKTMEGIWFFTCSVVWLLHLLLLAIPTNKCMQYNIITHQNTFTQHVQIA